MSKLTIVAQITAKSEHIETVKAELEKLIEPSRQDEGCISYDLHQDNANPAHFIFFENWASKAALEAHMQAPHFQAFGAATQDMIEAFNVNELTHIS